MRPLQGSLPDMTLPDIKKIFPAVLDMKNANKVQKKLFFRIVRKIE